MRRTGLPPRDLRILDPLLSYPSTILGRERAIVINLEHIKAIITTQEILLLNSRDPSVTPFVRNCRGGVLCHYNATKAQAKTLEQEAHPALDKLTSKISTLNLERVRQIKSRLVAITGRVQKVRDELEHLLDDDEDMAEMYLTEKLVQHLENSSTTSLNERDDMDDEYLLADLDDRIPAEVSLDAHGASTSGDGDIHNADNPQDHLFSAPHLLSRGSHGTHTSTTRSAISKHLDVEELEMLLEAYFVQIDGTLNKLSTVSSLVFPLDSPYAYLFFIYA
ncbi:hypothetical protein GH714_009822 [Hevea brasiliensis]|uniref:Magnesium transporter n=1 Tax=Hevea brasiliensis TaxID=3981 RepID=A0A6A6L1Y3_HEVBR|nr:hypothetical protein GH714_009822 [Hevea brasiliensis]